MSEIRPVREIQTALMTAAEELVEISKKIRLVELMAELERNYPDRLDAERISEGELCPPVAWEIHADVGNAKILLEEVVQSLEKASRRTEAEVRMEWIEERLTSVKDPSTRALLLFLLERER